MLALYTSDKFSRAEQFLDGFMVFVFSKIFQGHFPHRRNDLQVRVLFIRTILIWVADIMSTSLQSRLFT